MENGKAVPHPEEAEAVVMIFNAYISGKGMKKIAAQMQIPHNNNTIWFSATIQHILRNRLYLGTEHYPPLISEELYLTADNMRKKRHTSEYSLPEELQKIRKMLFCAECGRPLFPDALNPDKWRCCNQKCLMPEVEVSVQELTEAILEIMNAVIENPFLLNSDAESAIYSPDSGILRQQNEIRRMMENPQIDYERIKSEVFQLAEMKYACCTYSDISQKTEFLKKLLSEQEQLNHLDIGLLKSCVKRMTVSHSAVIEIEFINSTKISKSIERTEPHEHST